MLLALIYHTLCSTTSVLLAKVPTFRKLAFLVTHCTNGLIKTQLLRKAIKNGDITNRAGLVFASPAKTYSKANCERWRREKKIYFWSSTKIQSKVPRSISRAKQKLPGSCTKFVRSLNGVEPQQKVSVPTFSFHGARALQHQPIMFPTTHLLVTGIEEALHQDCLGAAGR